MSLNYKKHARLINNKISLKLFQCYLQQHGLVIEKACVLKKIFFKLFKKLLLFAGKVLLTFRQL